MGTIGGAKKGAPERGGDSAVPGLFMLTGASLQDGTHWIEEIHSNQD